MTRPVRDHYWRRAWKTDALSEQGGRCAYCFSDVKSRDVSADHVVPRASHGCDHKSNIKATCAACNAAKRDMSLSAFKKAIKSGEGGLDIRMAWARRRINLAADRACKRLAHYAGVAA